MESIAAHTGHPEYFSTATVITANPATLTCDILKTKGGMLYGVPILNTTGGLQSNDASWASNLRGAVVFYTYLDGQPYIMGTIPVAAKPGVPTSTSSTSTDSGGDNKLTYGATRRDSYTCGRPASYMPGDKVFSTDGGAELALLSEGGIVLKASPMSQIIMGALMDFVKIIARELTISTDFGDISFSHGSSGRTGMSIVGGAKYGDEAQPGSGTPCFRWARTTKSASWAMITTRWTASAPSKWAATRRGPFSASSISLSATGKTTPSAPISTFRWGAPCASARKASRSCPGRTAWDRWTLPARPSTSGRHSHMATPTAKNGKCPEGYTHVFGPLCVEKTTLDKVSDALPDIPDADFTSPDCEMALGALQQVHKAVEKLIQLPKRIMSMAKKLLDYPFDRARELMDGALKAFDDVSEAIDAFLDGPQSAVADLKRALEKALDCPYIARTELGQLIEEVLDMLDAGKKVDALVNRLKNALSSKANSALDALEETPAEALSNASKLFNDALDRLGVKDWLDKLEELERCVEAACAMYDVAKRLPGTSAKQLWESLNGAVDEAGNRLEAAVARPVGAAQETAMKVAEDFRLAKAKVTTT